MLIARNEYKALRGVTGSGQDAQIDALIPGLSQLVLNITDRDFDTVATLGTRQYLYDGSGYLEIDDATTVTVVAWDGAAALNVADYTVHAQNGVLTQVELPATPRGVSPEMGFTRNLDRYPWYAQSAYRKVNVTGTFGWKLETDGTRTPPDIKLALAWGIADYISTRPDVTGEAIATYSIQYAQLSAEEAFSTAALDILDLYKRYVVA